MLVKNARFVKSIKDSADYPDLGLPEIAVCGRSNVGKSSLINLLTDNHKIARVSSTPGKTRLINFFIINEKFTLVDLPGYGYAKVAKTEQHSWGKMVEDYLNTSVNLSAFLILVDIRRDITSEDMKIFNWASYYGLRVIIAATKSDKLSKTKIPVRLRELKKMAGGVDYPSVAVSSLKKTGRQLLLDEIEKALFL